MGENNRGFGARFLMQRRKDISLRILPTQVQLRRTKSTTHLEHGASSVWPIEDVETLSHGTEVRGRRTRVAIDLSRRRETSCNECQALVLTIGLNLPKQILSAQSEAKKEENFINKDLHGMINKLEPRG
ncbi:hypothetical protein Tco_0917899 [Tanacetum coccineum]